MDKFNLKRFLTESKLTESKFKIGDEVVLKGTDIEPAKVIDMRRMFGSDLMAYGVEFPNGDVAEYDETQLSLNPVKEQYSTMGGYVELMDLDDHLDSIHYEFEKWREGPMTEPTDIEPAKEDVISYVVDYLRNTL
tara:strand:+ start:350 stop:754 length:405 start_codon:yes stop_codon:yes gene_type:complete